MVLLIRKGLQRCCWVGRSISDEIVCGSSCGSRVVDDRCICCDGMVSQRVASVCRPFHTIGALSVYTV